MMVVRRIKDFGNDFRLILVLHAALIITLRKEFHIKLGDVARTPQTENGNGIAVLPRDHHIIGDRLDYTRSRV